MAEPILTIVVERKGEDGRLQASARLSSCDFITATTVVMLAMKQLGGVTTTILTAGGDTEVVLPQEPREGTND